MHYSISPDRRTLTITVTDTERVALSIAGEDGSSICTDAYMADFLEPIVANSSLDWILPSETGDLTDAPMLGIRDWQSEHDSHVVLERWAWMNYQVKSLLEQLRDHGRAVLVGGN